MKAFLAVIPSGAESRKAFPTALGVRPAECRMLLSVFMGSVL